MNFLWIVLALFVVLFLTGWAMQKADERREARAERLQEQREQKEHYDRLMPDAEEAERARFKALADDLWSEMTKAQRANYEKSKGYHGRYRGGMKSVKISDTYTSERWLIDALIERYQWALDGSVAEHPFTLSREGKKLDYLAARNPLFDYAPQADADTIYLMEHRGLRAGKVGISGKATRRIGQHEAEGWQEVASWKVPETGKAELIERETLTMVRVKAPQPALTAEQMPQGGFSETWALDAVSLDDAEAFIDGFFDSLNTVEFG